MVAHARPSPRIVLLVGAAVTAVVVGGLLVRAGSADGDRGAEANANGQADTGDVDTDPGADDAASTAGTPAAARPDEASAVTAAIACATAPQEWLYLTDDQLEVEVRAATTAAAADRLPGEVIAEVTLARDRLAGSSGRVWWLVRPLAWEVDHHQGNTARVSVWVVTVLSAADVAAPQAEYATVTIDLAWVDGTWRVDDVLDRPGPTPMTGPMDQPWDAVPFDDALAGFTRITGERDR